jgi:hypothetical protein
MIEFLFFFCLPTLTGYDCSGQVYMTDMDTVNELYEALGNKGTVAAFYNPNTNVIVLADYSTYNHEWRHAWCENFYKLYNENHEYCLLPHFKLQR